MARIRWPHTITLALFVFAAVNFFGTYAATHILVPKDFRVTSAWQTREFLLGRAQDDSWYFMRLALDQTRTAQAEPLYPAVFFKQKNKFQYPPSSLLTLDLLDHLYGQRITTGGLNKISWVCVLILAVVVPATYICALRKFSPALAGHFNTVDILLQAVLLSLMTITFYPITKGFAIGNIQTWLTCLFACSVLAWISGYEVVAGILIGLIVTVKPQLALLLVWGILRSRRRFVAGCVTTLIVVEDVSLWRYGLKNQIDYLSVLSFLSAHGESYFSNQSVNGLLARMLHIGNNSYFLDHEFAPFHPLVYCGTLIGAVLMIGVSLFWLRKKTDEKSLLTSFLVASLLITMASPIAWEHHYGIMISIYACFFAIFMGTHFRRKWLIWTGISYVLASNVLFFTNLAADTGWNFVQSYLFAAAALLVFVMYRFTANAELRIVEAGCQT